MGLLERPASCTDLCDQARPMTKEDRMKKTFTLGTLLLGCCLAATAQTGSTPNQSPTIATPPTFPQDQTGQTPSNPTSPADPSAIPPDTSAPGRVSNSRTMSVQGCLRRSSDGSFVMASNSGSDFQLHGDSSELNSYVGNEVSVIGSPLPSSGSTAGAMASSTSDSSAGQKQPLSVSHVRKVSDVCTSAGSTNKQ